MGDCGSITRWINDLRNGDAIAADGLWQRYYRRLIELARKKLGDAPRRIADEDDVVSHAFDCFFRGLADDRFPRLDDRHDLWQILVMLTARKATDQIKKEARKKRGGGPSPANFDYARLSSEERVEIDQIVGSEPTPEFAASIAEQCQQLLEILGDKTLCAVAIAKMEGYSNAEIAERMGVQVRTIERKLRLTRKLWSEYLP